MAWADKLLLFSAGYNTNARSGYHIRYGKKCYVVWIKTT